jgi:Ala-tRNA(Pro) deacylase
MPDTSSIHEFLRDAHVPYSVVPQRQAFSIEEEAAAPYLPGKNWAKVVICFVDGDPIEAVLPGPLAVNLDRLLELARGDEIRVAREHERRHLFPECEQGAMPPFGSLNGHPMFVDVALAAEPEIVFDAGTHTEAIYMRWADFAATVRPIVGKFAEPLRDRVGAFRLSYRE